MTIRFVEYRGQTMSHRDQMLINNLFKQLTNQSSYFTNLQVTYNNSDHFVTVPYNLCDRDVISKLGESALSPEHVIVVQGSIHTNHHVSNMLLDIYGNGLLAQDTYIRVVYDGKIHHVLMQPPKIKPVPYMMSLSYQCPIPQFIIPPIQMEYSEYM